MRQKLCILIQKSVDIAARWTEQNDMKINSEKSKQIIISFAQDSNFRSIIPNVKIDGRDIAQVCHAKLLGVTISQDLTWNKHVKKAGKRLYMLYQLKRAGITQKDLVSVHVSVVTPVLEYACPVCHTNLPQYLSDNIEVIQKKGIKMYFSWIGIRRRVNLDTLNVRRNSICLKCVNKIKVGTHRLNYLLSDKRHTEYNIKQQNVYPLPVTRTNRFRSFLQLSVKRLLIRND